MAFLVAASSSSYHLAHASLGASLAVARLDREQDQVAYRGLLGTCASVRRSALPLASSAPAFACAAETPSAVGSPSLVAVDLAAAAAAAAAHETAGRCCRLRHLLPYCLEQTQQTHVALFLPHCRRHFEPLLVALELWCKIPSMEALPHLPPPILRLPSRDPSLPLLLPVLRLPVQRELLRYLRQMLVLQPPLLARPLHFAVR